MLLDECNNLLATLPIIANLNRMAVMTKMNASPLTHVISMDVEDPSAVQCHLLGGLLANLANKNGSRRQGSSNMKGLFCDAFEIHIIIGRSSMSTIKVLAMRILTAEVTNTRG